MDPMEITTELEPNGTGRFFEAQDLMVGLSYARSLTDKFRAGVTEKYVRQSIWNETASAFAIDIGTQYELWFSNFVIGMSLTNFGTDMRLEGRDLSYKLDTDPDLPKNRLTPALLETEYYTLPLHFQVGVSMDLFRTEAFILKAALDVTHPNDNDERINIGTEALVLNILALRAGYRMNYDDENFTAGVGLIVPFGESSARLDYGFANYQLLPAVHRFSISLEF